MGTEAGTSSARLPRTRVYIDGFNLYYAAYDRAGLGRWKWLNLWRLCEQALPRNRLEAVRYFSARVSATPSDPGKPVRQDAYLRALETIPGLTIHWGQFVINEKHLKLVNPPKRGDKRAHVYVAEEKGSDVNLASYLLLDAFKDAYDVAVIVSNDSDLREPVRIVREELGKTVGVLKVEGEKRICVFRREVDFIRPLREGHFRNSQLPDPVMDASGRPIAKPPEWR